MSLKLAAFSSDPCAPWVVFGAGGDRDPMKRPLMGEACSRLADRLVVTSDNPRSEEPTAIIAAIMRGVKGGEAVVEPDRLKAIRYALANAAEDDVVIIAGKGHETTQEIAGVKHPFDDRVIARSYSLVKSLCCFLFSVLLGAEVFGATGETFLSSGKMTLGANYWASHAATQMWRRWDAQVVEQDLKTLADRIGRLLPLAMKEVLSAHPWAFAMEEWRTGSGRVGIEGVGDYSEAVTVPDDCIKVIGVYGRDGTLLNWQRVAGEIRADGKACRVTYVRNVDELDEFSPDAYRLVVLRLAADMTRAMSLRASLQNLHENVYRDALAEAKTRDTRQSNPGPEVVWGGNYYVDRMTGRPV